MNRNSQRTIPYFENLLKNCNYSRLDDTFLHIPISELLTVNNNRFRILEMIAFYTPISQHFESAFIKTHIIRNNYHPLLRMFNSNRYNIANGVSYHDDIFTLDLEHTFDFKQVGQSKIRQLLIGEKNSDSGDSTLIPIERYITRRSLQKKLE